MRWSGTEEVNATHGTFVHLLCLRKSDVVAEGDILIDECFVSILEIIEDLSGYVRLRLGKTSTAEFVVNG